MAGELGSGGAGMVTIVPIPAECLTMLGMPALLQQLHRGLAKAHRHPRSSHQELLTPATGSELQLLQSTT